MEDFLVLAELRTKFIDLHGGFTYTLLEYGDDCKIIHIYSFRSTVLINQNFIYYTGFLYMDRFFSASTRGSPFRTPEQRGQSRVFQEPTTQQGERMAQTFFFFGCNNGTLPETKIAPENQWLEDEISFWDALFSGAMLVSGSVIPI